MELLHRFRLLCLLYSLHKKNRDDTIHGWYMYIKPLYPFRPATFYKLFHEFHDVGALSIGKGRLRGTIYRTTYFIDKKNLITLLKEDPSFQLSFLIITDLSTVILGVGPYTDKEVKQMKSILDI